MLFYRCREGPEGLNPSTKLLIMPNILHNIGGTPLVRINKIAGAESEGLQCELRTCAAGVCFDDAVVLFCCL